MFERIITFSVRNPLVIGIGVIALIVWGVLSFRNLPIDAVPDITNNQVQVVTLSPSLAAQEVERFITIPVEQTMATIDGIVERRSISRFGLSVVTLVFEDDVDVYWARAQVDQRLTEAQEAIPRGSGSPVMMPITTGLGEIFQYTLHVDDAHSGEYNAMDLRTIHDWMIRRRLLGTEGVADVASFGGFLRQVEIAVDPERLQAYGLSMTDVLEAVERNNANSGGAYIERGPEVAYIRTEGMVTSLSDVEEIIIRPTADGLPILVRNVGVVRDGHAVRYGALTINDEGEGVGGIVYMLKGENSSKVIETVKQRIEEIESTLPEGITIAPYLDRSDLVNRTIKTVATNLIEGALIVIFVLVLMMGNFRAGIIVASVIPLSMLFAIGMMTVFGVSGNLMSLGAIDFGLIVDGAVIVVEHILHRLTAMQALGPSPKAQGPGSRAQLIDTKDVIRRAAIEIRQSAALGEGIILIVYIPLLTLIGIEGKMFKPMAQTVMFAIMGAFILSTTYVPMMSSLILKVKPRSGPTLSDRIMALLYLSYQPMRRLALRNAVWVIGAGLALFAAAIIAFMNIGSEFIPTLHEGDFAVETRLIPGSSLTETVEISQKAARILKQEFPEVKAVIGKIGTTEIPLDPMPLEASDVMVILKPRAEWTSARTREELASKMEDALTVLPGVEFGFQQPIQMRFNELMTGARQDVVIKVYGEDMDELASLASSIGHVCEGVEGATDVFVEPVGGLPQIVVKVDRAACALYHVDVEDVNTTVRAAFAGEPAGLMFEGEKHFDVVLRLHPDDKVSLSSFERLTVNNAKGELLPLPQLADIQFVDGPNQIQREDGRRRIYVGFNVRDRDVTSIVEEVRTKLNASLQLPPGYEITYGGQFENLAEANARLAIALPAALLLILALLYLTSGSLTDTLLIFTAVPFSAVGGIAALMIRGMPFSISAGVGFIALFGVAVLNGIVLMAAFRQLRSKGMMNDLRVVIEGTTQRLRPVTMTALVASLGFLPMAISSSDGAEVQRPLATVVIGGLITSTLLTMVILPVLYHLVYRFMNRSTRSSSASTGGRIAAAAFLMMFAGGATQALHAQAPLPLSRDSIRAIIQRNNIDVYAAHNLAEQSRALKGAAIAWDRTSIEWMGGQYNAFEFDNAFTIQQNIPWFGTMSARSDLFDEQAESAQMQAVLAERDVMARTEQAFDQIAHARETLRLIDSLQVVLERAVHVVEARQTHGDATMLERVSATSQLSEITAQRNIHLAELQRAETMLRILCNDVAVTTTDSVLYQRPLPAESSLAGVITTSAEAPVRVAEAEKRVASSAYLPDLTLGYMNQSLIGATMPDGSVATAANRFNVFTLGIQVPLLFGPTSAREEQATLNMKLEERRRDAALMSYERKREQLVREVQAYKTTLDHYNGPAVDQVRTLVEHSTRAYEAGQVGWLELQRAVEQAVKIRMNRLEALLKYNSAVISLELLTKD